MKDLDAIRKQSLLSLELNSNTRSNIVQSELIKFTQNVKKLSTKKNLILFVIEKS